MPLTKPSPRNLIHTRDIKSQGYQRDDGLWDIECRLTDTKTYSFENADRGGINAGEPIHAMLVRLTIDESLTVHKAEAALDAGPFNLCGDVTGRFRDLAGLSIGPGWRKAVMQRLGRAKGCTHLTDMLLGPMAVTAYQTVAAARSRRESPASDGAKPATLDTCHALASDSPVVRKHWPRFYTGEKK